MNQLKGQIGVTQVGRIQDKRRKELVLRKEDKYMRYLQMDYANMK